MGSAYVRANKQSVSSCSKLFVRRFTISVVSDVKFNMSLGLTRALSACKFLSKEHGDVPADICFLVVLYTVAPPFAVSMEALIFDEKE